jgi:acetyl-CoA carboxylase biotin carboxyl carrier protein
MAQVKVISEVAGSVWQIVAKAGDRIAEGEPLVVMESMKMEIPVLAEKTGTVKEILVEEGEMVSEGQAVAILES